MEEQIMMKPNNHMALAILTTICCCLPLGIVAIVKASSVDSLYVAKQYTAAMAAANEAQNRWYAGIFISLIIWGIYILAFGGLATLGGFVAFGS